MKLRCSCCGEEKLPEWFSVKKGARGRSYWCKACKRLCDLRRLYRNNIKRALSKIDEWERKIAAIQEKIGPRRRKVSASPSLSTFASHQTLSGSEPQPAMNARSVTKKKESLGPTRA